MRLSKIKLAGFKSFLDPTTIELPSNLVGIVGPNGCGKSNIIDAVRWVMGESSAKNLRGDSMADVIFNGSSARKPASTASIELIFDNSDGVIGGQYAGYNEISVRRSVNRTGHSDYFLNGTKCRRKDITAIFLGTGLGPRSYSIIEQGMVSRLIEAKPEDLRAFLEEAAGISKYKERRRETENRIRHTRENLDRLNDLREEIEKQIHHLDRQAQAAEKYKTFKSEERVVKAEVLALRLRDMQGQSQEQEKFLAEHETAVEKAISEQRKIESSIEKARTGQTEANDAFNEVQGRFYKASADISRLEQAIQHAKDVRKSQEEQLQQTEKSFTDIQGHINRDQEQVTQFADELKELEPELEVLQGKLSESRDAQSIADEKMQQWLQTWEDLQQASAESQKTSHIERTRIEHLEGQMQQDLVRRDQLRKDRKGLSLDAFESTIKNLFASKESQQSIVSEFQSKIDTASQTIQSLREAESERSKRLDESRRELQRSNGRLASLKALQEAALGKQSNSLSKWLEREGLDKAKRLGESLKVSAPWEAAVEIVLGPALEAICVDEVQDFVQSLAELDEAQALLVDSESGPKTPGTLAQYVQSESAQFSGLQYVYAAADVTAAMRKQKELKAWESVITPEGLWLGPDWIRVSRNKDPHSGVLAREQEIRQLETDIGRFEALIADLAEEQANKRSEYKLLEQQRDEAQAESNRANRQFADIRAQLNSQEERRSQLSERINSLDTDLDGLDKRIAANETDIKQARARLEDALQVLKDFSDQQQELEKQREPLKQNLQNARDRVNLDQEKMQASAIRFEARKAAYDSLQQNLERMQNQIAQLQEQRGELQRLLRIGVDPQKEQEQQLTETLQLRTRIETEMKAARNTLEEVESSLREFEQQRLAAESNVQSKREELQNVKMALQEIRVRQDTVNEQLVQTGFQFEEINDQLTAEATLLEWQERLERLQRKIQRLGAINLAAIEEFKEQSQRKEYLDKQNDDLLEALQTLEDAISKIDRETRTRFKETFDRVNAGFKEKFPQLFGGGHAYLELTGDDLLDTGVTVMARPPGKRNSTIHLLSGGEKALTAVAMVFSIFELNPAPFCILDEVDAPLDDANVGRYCEIVKKMAERVQFIFITHNKITMELAQQLSGVTMHEPGVSRIVAVDIDEAVELAA